MSQGDDNPPQTVQGTQGFPYITVSPSLTPDGNPYGGFTPGTTTSGLAEAAAASFTKYGTVYLELLAGTFTCSTTFALDAGGQSNGGKIKGAGKALSVITWAAGKSGTLMSYNQTAVATTNWEFRDFTVLGKSAPGAPLVSWTQKEGGARHEYINVLVQESTAANAYTTSDLNGAINAAVTTVNVDSAAGVPAVPFTIFVEAEQMSVTSTGTGLNWTVTRGFNSSIAASHADETPYYVAVASNALSIVGAEDCRVASLQTISNNPSPFPAAFFYSCPGGALRTDECVFYTAEILAAQWLDSAGAAQSVCMDTAGVPAQYEIDGLFINPNTIGPPFQVQKVKSNSQIILSFRTVNLNGAYANPTNNPWFASGVPMIHDLTANVKLFLEMSGSDTYINTQTNGTPAAAVSDASQFLCRLLSPSTFTNWSQPHIDARIAVAATDGSPITLATWVTTFSSSPMARINYRICGNSGTVTSGVYTLKWTEAGQTFTKTVTISAVTGEAHDTILCMPDTGTAITVQLTTLTGTTPKVNVTASVEPYN